MQPLMKIMTNYKLVLGTVMMLLVVATRSLPHAPNFTPVLAMGLFAFAVLKNWRVALAVLFGCLLVSDYFIGFYAVDSMVSVYLSTALAAVLGLGYKFKANLHSGFQLAIRGFFASVIFFTLTNLGVWYFGGLYAPTGAGLINCFVAAIPFFHNTLISTVLYGFVLFAAFHWLEARGAVNEKAEEASGVR